jgi:hypothetical protein
LPQQPRLSPILPDTNSQEGVEEVVVEVVVEEEEEEEIQIQINQ